MNQCKEEMEGLQLLRIMDGSDIESKLTDEYIVPYKLSMVYSPTLPLLLSVAVEAVASGGGRGVVARQ